MMANAQTSDQTMADVASFLELGAIVSTVAWLCQPSPVKSNGATTLFFPCSIRSLSAREVLQTLHSWFSSNDLQLKTDNSLSAGRLYGLTATELPGLYGKSERPGKLAVKPPLSLCL